MSEARSPHASASPEVQTVQGRVRGAQRVGYQAFLGLPFARPPVGALRFAAPTPPAPWSGVRDATQFGNSALQGHHPIPGMAASGPRDEDCLYLNVYTPAADAARRPVLFWIHGGGFVFGSGSEALYDGGRLAVRGDVVVVTIHYRLGVFGYLDLSAHGGDAIGATANAGQLDQIAALRWVRDNIGGFGGDPDQVTIFGESAGSAAVATLLAMPDAAGRFHRAILQSGAANPLAESATATKLAARLMEHTGANSAQALRALDAQALLKAQFAVAGAPGSGLSFAPVVDGRTVPTQPLEAVAAGAARAVDVIIGTNRDEMKLFNVAPNRAALGDAELVDRIAALVAPLRRRAGLEPAAREAIERIIAGYRDARAGRLPAENTDLLDAIQGDLQFRLPSIRLAEAQSGQQPNTRMFLFVHESPARRGAYGACHALELSFVFGTLDAPTQDRFAGSGPAVEALSGQMMDAWIGFARSGDPGHAAIGDWPTYAAADRQTMVFGTPSAATGAPFENERRLWDGVL